MRLKIYLSKQTRQSLFSTWHYDFQHDIELLNIQLEEKFLIKYDLIKHLTLLKNPKYDGHQKGLASIVHQFF